MYTIMGVTGQVGSEVARHLLAAGKPVRAVVRSVEKGQPWAARGCELAVADVNDLPGLTQAFQNSTAVFVLLPPISRRPKAFPKPARSSPTCMTHWPPHAPKKSCASPPSALKPLSPICSINCNGWKKPERTRPAGDISTARLVHGKLRVGH